MRTSKSRLCSKTADAFSSTSNEISTQQRELVRARWHDVNILTADHRFDAHQNVLAKTQADEQLRDPKDRKGNDDDFDESGMQGLGCTGSWRERVAEIEDELRLLSSSTRVVKNSLADDDPTVAMSLC